MNTNKEDIMNDDKTKASASTDENLQEALVLRPEWEVKPKSTETENNFTVSFSEKTRVLLLKVNGDFYKKIPLDDITEGKVKFHEILSHVITKFELWGIRAKN
tara:strand:- start:241 stop:549 length:309 start_codon:yes stop_codon:yes gene_type:complete